LDVVCLFEYFGVVVECGSEEDGFVGVVDVDGRFEGCE